MEIWQGDLRGGWESETELKLLQALAGNRYLIAVAVVRKAP